MNELNFKHWMEAFLDNPSKTANRIRDLRTQRAGTFTGFEKPPGIASRFGSDVVGGLSNYVRQIKADNSTQEPNSTFDFGKEIDKHSDGHWVTFTIPWDEKILYKTKSGDYLDKHGKKTDKANAIRDAQIGKKARQSFLEFMVNHAETRQTLLNNHLNIDSVKYYGVEPTDEKGENGESLVLLKFVASKLPIGQRLTKYDTEHPNHKYVYNTGENT